MSYQSFLVTQDDLDSYYDPKSQIYSLMNESIGYNGYGQAIYNFVSSDDNTINSDFKPSTNSFSCANHILFTINQTHTQYLNQTPTIIIFNNITNTAQVSISTYYNFINPTLSTNECSGTV